MHSLHGAMHHERLPNAPVEWPGDTSRPERANPVASDH
jgi:hypothetical protein